MFGRPITDPETIEARFMVECLRRLNTKGAKAGRTVFETVTVSELAQAAKITPARVLEIVREFGSAWLLGLIETDGPSDLWWVFQDGE